MAKHPEQDDLELAAWHESSVEFANHLNVKEIYDHIRTYLTKAESAMLINPNVSDDQKIRELKEFFPKKGGRWFENFMDALKKTKACTGHDVIIRALNSRIAKGNFLMLHACNLARLY